MEVELEFYLIIYSIFYSLPRFLLLSSLLLLTIFIIYLNYFPLLLIFYDI
jgi:hypothetical protein